MNRRLFATLLGGAGLALLAVAPALAQDAAPTINKGDTAWMLTSTILVILMTIPGLALFYGGLVRTKNMLSLLTQVFAVFSLVAILWVFYGYSLAFTSGPGSLGAIIGGLSKAFLAGVTNETTADTFTKGVAIPEMAFLAFQLTFAAITPALIVGAFAERMKFSAIMLFTGLWLTFVYLPIAHMVWFSEGYLFALGALDFAGGTVVHINSGVAGLVGALMVGKRIGYRRDLLAPHSLTLTFVGACLLWVGWFGFNAGSNLEANGLTGQVVFNTILATAAAALAWTAGEWVTRGHPSLLGAVSGAVAGLVAITPACGWVSPTASLIIGILAGIICLWAVVWLKAKLGYDDALDVFGVHGIGGILGALLTGYFVNPGIGGVGVTDYLATDTSVKALEYSFSAQMTAQVYGVLTAVILSAVVSYVALMICKFTTGLRVPEQEEREGLDIGSHGERAYS